MDPLSFFSPEELGAWADHRLMRDWLQLTGLALKLGFLVAVLASGLHQQLRTLAENLADRLYARPSLRLAPAERGRAGRLLGVLEKLADREGNRPGSWVVDTLYPTAFTFLWALLILPFVFFISYVLPHERQMATISMGLWWADWGKGLVLNGLLFGLLGLGLFGLARRLPRTWWLWLWGATVGMLLLWSLLSPYRARIYHDFDPLPDGPARRAVVQVLAEANLEPSHIQVVDTSRRSKHAAAFVMGEGPSRRVVLGDNLVREFHPREIQMALAHELGHEQLEHQDRGWLTMAAGAFLFLLLVRLLLWKGPRIRLLGLRPNADPAVLPLIMLSLLVLFLVNQPISAWLDRAEERQADQRALELTRDPAAFCSLMVRLARVNQADPDPPGWRTWFWSHHPSVAERIRNGTAWAEANGIKLGPGAVPLPGPGQVGLATRIEKKK